MSNTATHKRKLHLARTMMTDTEVRFGVPPFQSDAWLREAKQKALRHQLINKPKYVRPTSGQKVKKVVKRRHDKEVVTTDEQTAQIQD